MATQHSAIADNYCSADGTRTALSQAGIQMAALGISLCIAIIGGIVTGAIMNLSWWSPPMSREELFNDRYEFEVEEDEFEFEKPGKKSSSSIVRRVPEVPTSPVRVNASQSDKNSV